MKNVLMVPWYSEDNAHYVYEVNEGNTVYWHNNEEDNIPLEVTKVTKQSIYAGGMKFSRKSGDQFKRGVNISYITRKEI